MNCFITQTGCFLPGPSIPNHEIEKYLGSVEGEEEVKKTILKMNGIVNRHYAQDDQQQPTFDVYQLACEAIQDCLAKRNQSSHNASPRPVSLLAAGTTYAPLGGPGIGSILHSHLQQRGLLSHPVEIGSHAGICSSAAAAMVSAIRSVAAGEHEAAICVGAEHPSSALKAAAFDPVDDRQEGVELRKTKWFMSTFLRFMLSDGAGAFLLEHQPKSSGVSFQVNWTHSRSYAHETPLCMKLENQGVKLTQDITILSKHLVPSARKFSADAMQRYNDDLVNYKVILPHLSSFFFRKKCERTMQEFSSSSDPVPYWTNLATAGNTGSASIYIMLDQYIRDHEGRTTVTS